MDRTKQHKARHVRTKQRKTRLCLTFINVVGPSRYTVLNCIRIISVLESSGYSKDIQYASDAIRNVIFGEVDAGGVSSLFIRTEVQKQNKKAHIL